MAQALSALYNLLDRQIKQGESERALTGFVFTLERKYEKQQTFICSLSPVVQKPVNANLRLKVNQGFCFSC